jgi:hypothetical protein
LDDVCSSGRKAIQSLRPSDFAPAFGRPVAASRCMWERPKAEALGYLEAIPFKTDRALRDGPPYHPKLAGTPAYHPTSKLAGAPAYHPTSKLAGAPAYHPTSKLAGAPA